MYMLERYYEVDLKGVRLVVDLPMDLVPFLKLRDCALLFLEVGWSSTGRMASVNSSSESLASQSKSTRRIMASTKLSFGMKEKRRRKDFKLSLSMMLRPGRSISRKN